MKNNEEKNSNPKAETVGWVPIEMLGFLISGKPVGTKPLTICADKEALKWEWELHTLCPMWD